MIMHNNAISNYTTSFRTFMAKQSSSSPTSPVVLRGCQVDGQVDSEEDGWPLRHVDNPHTQVHSRSGSPGIRSGTEKNIKGG